MKTFETPKGTILSLINLKGKDYLPVQQRVRWFREEHPDWGIETQVDETGPDSAIAAAFIKNEHGRVIAMAHKVEDKKGFADYKEKSETGAIGRALALCGYGTQFTEDLDEGTERIVDAPVGHPGPSYTTPASSWKGQGLPSVGDTGEYVVPFGKFKGQQLKHIPLKEIKNYVEWLQKDALKKGEPLSNGSKLFIQTVETFLDEATTAQRIVKAMADEAPPTYATDELPF